MSAACCWRPTACRVTSPSSTSCCVTATAQRPQRSNIRVVVNGAGNGVGKAAIAAISKARGMEVVGAVDSRGVGEDAGTFAGMEQELEIPILNDLVMVLGSTAQAQAKGKGVMVDVSSDPSGVYENVRQATAFGLCSVVAVPGLDLDVVAALSTFCDKATTGCIVAPTLSIGLLLLQQAAASAAFRYKHVEMIESANEPAPFPSSLATQVAESLSGLGQIYNDASAGADTPARGAAVGDGVRVHSLVMPGVLSSLDVRFSGPGEMLSIRHDVTDVQAFMPGLVLAIRKVVQLKSLVYGLDKIM